MSVLITGSTANEVWKTAANLLLKQENILMGRTGEVYEQDVKMILKTLKEINDLFDKHLDIELDARNKLYDEAKKKLFSIVRETRKGTFEEWVYCG